MIFANQIKAEENSFSRGKTLVQNNCAACHIIGRNFTGPNLSGFEERGQWAEKENIYQWIRNPGEFMKKDQYTKELKKEFSGVMMASFPELTNEDIDEIINYLSNTKLSMFPEVVVD